MTYPRHYSPEERAAKEMGREFTRAMDGYMLKLSAIVVVTCGIAVGIIHWVS